MFIWFLLKVQIKAFRPGDLSKQRIDQWRKAKPKIFRHLFGIVACFYICFYVDGCCIYDSQSIAKMYPYVKVGAYCNMPLPRADNEAEHSRS